MSPVGCPVGCLECPLWDALWDALMLQKMITMRFSALQMVEHYVKILLELAFHPVKYQKKGAA